MAEKKANTEALRLLIAEPKHYLATISGIGGLLMDRLFLPGEEASLLSKLRGGATGKVSTEQREELLWRYKLYFRDDLGVYIPGRNISRSLREGTIYWGQKIPGGGQRTYTDVVKSGLRCGDAPLGTNGKSMQINDPSIEAFGCYVPAGGKSGGKIWTVRPMIRPWVAQFTLHIFDPRLTPEVLRFIFSYAGQYKGICAYREEFGHYEISALEEIVGGEVRANVA